MNEYLAEVITKIVILVLLIITLFAAISVARLEIKDAFRTGKCLVINQEVFCR